MKVGTGDQSSAYKENEDLYKRMNKNIEKKIILKEKEIKNLDTIYDKKIAQTHIEGEDQFVQALDRNNQRVSSESIVFEDKIKSYQDRLKKIQDTVALEETTLKTTSNQRLDEMKTQMETNFQEQYSAIQENQNQIIGDSQSAVRENASKAKTEKILLENNAQYEINALSSGLNTKAANNEKDFRSKLDSDMRLHNAEINSQKEELKKLTVMDAEKNKRLSNELQIVNKGQLDFQEQHQKDMLLQRDNDFKIRYANMVKEHNTILNNLSAKFDEDARRIKFATSEDKKILDSRSEDSFYRVETINPKLIENQNDVTVHIPVADYEKENVHLSTRGRLIKITLSRKYTDSINENDGSLNKTTRSELFSKELPTTDLLSPKNITQSYENGVLSFKIKKA